MEVMSKENTDMDSGYIDIVWGKNSSVFDYDRHVGEAITRFEKTSLPITITAHHICCSPPFLATIMKPIWFAATDKRTRCRTMFHNVPEDQIVATLSTYGILGSMLPAEMGGDIQLSQSGWIEQRRAAEMLEI